MKTEILAPAGSQESLEAAVRAGADAVYLGTGNYNARRNAANFNEEQLKAAIQYCHKRGVRVYIALNTLISDTEMKDAMETVRMLCALSPDALILADLGLIDAVKEAAPDMPLHGSTQMSVHTPAGVRQLSEMGIKRVVLARELSKEEIKEIGAEAKRLGVELELFVHGALCMSVSGQCYFSAVLGGRSGNRGLCAGTCRLPFSVKNGTGYDLSLKDLSLLEEITILRQMGIDSLKIEGRMKRPEYVAAAVNAYRQAVDQGSVKQEDMENLQNVFSRSGFTKGYFEGKTGRDMFGIRAKDDVINSNEVLNALHALYRGERQSVSLHMELKVDADTPATLTVSDGEKIVTAVGEIPQQAVNRPLTEEYALSQLAKTGGTQYYIKTARAEIGQGLMLSASALNALRRDALAGLDEERGQRDPVAFRETVLPAKKKAVYQKPRIVISVKNTTGLPGSLPGVSLVYLPLFAKDEEIKKALQRNVEVGVRVPRGMFSLEDSIRKRLHKVKALGITTALAENIGAIPLIQQAGMTVQGGNGLNVFNSQSLQVVADLGITKQTVSHELSLDSISVLQSRIPLGLFAYGRLPLMLLRNCPVKNGGDCSTCTGEIVDRKDIHFPLQCESGCTELLNSAPLWLADRLQEISNIDDLFLSFTDETPEQTEAIIKSYVTGGEPPRKYTRGNYYKGVL